MTVNASTDLAFASQAAAAIAGMRRAALADRQAANALATEWRPLEQLEPIAGEWRDLAERALEPNVFYEPSFALPAARVFGRDAGAVLVWSQTQPRRLLGFFPARIERRRYGLHLPVLVGLTHPYGPLGVPLIEREAAEPIIAAWLEHVAGDPTLPGFLLLPFLPTDGAVATVLAMIVRRARMPTADFNRRRRALLAPSGERSRYIEQAIGARRQKELRRQWRRLSETGVALLTAATEPPAVATALGDFLALEAGGWKGRAGTATADRDDLRRFMRTAVVGLAAECKASINRILVDGRAIAAAIVLHSGRGAWFWKIAYDESFARFSPGVMLTVALTNELLEDAAIERADSCATENHPMIDRLWCERLPLCDRLVALRPQAPFAAVRRLEALRSAAIAAARRIRGHLQRR